MMLATLLIFSFVPYPATAQSKTELSLSLLPVGPTYGLKAGEDNKYFLEVRNYGTEGITDIKFSAEKPVGWTVIFNPERLIILAPGGLQTVDVLIRPPENAVKGRHDITFIANANETRKVVNYDFELESPSYWLWVGIGVAVVVIAGFILVFVRMGRKG
jgi:uncharacterized membrane protein